MNQQELTLILESHKKWLNDEDGGSRADLRGANLRGADLSGAILSGADLRGANLRGADLSGAILSGAILSDAILSGADLRGADLSGADLSGADLSGADLSGADLLSTHGNCKEIKTIQTDTWQIVYTKEIMQIGCQRHSISDWLSFDDERIGEMHTQALEWWRKWRPILVLILEKNK